MQAGGSKLETRVAGWSPAAWKTAALSDVSSCFAQIRKEHNGFQRASHTRVSLKSPCEVWMHFHRREEGRTEQTLDSA